MIFSNEILEQIATAARLKARLVKYYLKRENKYKPIISEYINKLGTKKDIMVNAIDWFIHCYRFRNGNSLIDLFIKGHNDLSDFENMLLEGWKGSFEGIFEVKSIDNDTVRLFNLIDEREYIAASNAGRAFYKNFKPGNYLMTRLLPFIDDIYLFSGEQYVYPPDAKDILEKNALKIAQSNPSHLRKSKLENKIGWDMQKRYRNDFITYFGADLIIITGNRLVESMEGFINYSSKKALKDVSDDKKEQYRNIQPKLNFPEELTGSDTVGIIFDEIEGLNFYPDFQLFTALFSDPKLSTDEKYSNVIMGYLASDSISTLPFRKMIEMYPQNSQKVFASLFNKQNWSNEKDFDILMKKHKGGFLKKKPEPMFFR